MLRVANCSHSANVWTHENRISSDGKTKESCLSGLLPNAKELIGLMIKVDGLTKLNGVFKHAPYKPNSIVTTDGFDQTVLYHTLQSATKYLMDFGFNIPKVIAGRRGNTFKITGHANGTTALNAWYSPQNGEMTFGTNSDKWHLASDSDVSTHEFGHLLLDHFHPGLVGWYAKEGGAIHEGYGDALASGYFNDAEMSEDFAPQKGRPESKTDGLRNVNNDLTLDDVSKEVHDRGRVYGGFWWSIRKVLADPNGPFKLSERQAADIMLKLLVNHGANYKTSRPEPKDFVDAIMNGMMALASQGQLGVDPGKLGSVIAAEATRRKMIKSPSEIKPPKKDFGSVSAVKDYLLRLGIQAFFDKVHTADFIGGTYEIYSQKIFSERFGYMTVIGRGLHIQRNRRGSIVSLSAKDILAVKNSQIEDDGDVDLKTAIELAVRHARSERTRIQNQIKNFYYGGGKRSVEELQHIQMEHEIAKTDLGNLTKIQQMAAGGSKPNVRVVLIDGSLTPQYEFKTGLSIYYVDTKTGGVTKKKDVIS